MALDGKADRRIGQVNTFTNTRQLSPRRILTSKDCSPTPIRTGVLTRRDSNPTTQGLRTKLIAWRNQQGSNAEAIEVCAVGYKD